MADLTMKKCMNMTQTEDGAGITRQKFEVNGKFVVKGQFLKLFRDNTFGGPEHENTDEHVERILEIANLYKTKYTTFNQFMLWIFLITLLGTAKCWLNNEPSRSITSWVELKI